MNSHYRLKTSVTLFIVVLFSAGCASSSAYKKGNRAEVRHDYDAALEQYRIALAEDPGSIQYKLKVDQTRFTAAFEHFQKGRRALEAGDVLTARAEFRRTLELDPTNDFARQELSDVDRVIQSRANNQPEPIIDLEKLQRSLQTNPNIGSQMKTTLTEPITFNMTTESRTVYENLATLAGLSVIFDSRFRSARVTINITTPVDIFEALDLVSLQTKNFWQPLNETTILVMEDTPTNRRDFEDHIFKTIYLANTTTTADLNGIINTLRTSLGLRNIFQSEALNAVVIHDIPARIALAERAIRQLDKAKGEVVIEATIIEVDRGQLRDLGISPPTETVLGFIPPGEPINSVSNAVRISDLNNLNSSNFSVTIPGAVARFLAQNSNAKLLTNPRIRTTDGVAAQIHVGSEIPVPTTSFTNTTLGGGANTSYQMQRVGVELNINAKVLLNREVSLVVNVTVRALAGDRQVGNILIPSFSTRLVAHTIRVREGETNILGGIISDTETESMTGIPGLKDIPILKYLFGQEHKTRDQAEVIIMLTPHIIRMPDITQDDMTGVYVGSESNLRLRPTYDRTPDPATPTTPVAPRPPAPAGTSTAAPGTAPAPAAPAPAPAAPPTPTTAVISFPAPVVVQGATSVDLAINGPDVLGTELTLQFDPASFSISEIREGGFLGREGQNVAVVRNIDNQKGTARITLERSPGAPVASGNGTLLTLRLQGGTKKGVSTLRVSEFGVRDNRQVLHPGRPAEVSVTVQ